MSNDVRVIPADEVRTAQNDAMQHYCDLLRIVRGMQVHADDLRRWWPEASREVMPPVVFAQPSETVYARSAWVQSLYQDDAKPD